MEIGTPWQLFRWALQRHHRGRVLGEVSTALPELPRNQERRIRHSRVVGTERRRDLYYYECPACGNVHDVDLQPVPRLWYDPARVSAEKLALLEASVRRDSGVLAVSTDGSWGITRIAPTLPHRACDGCGAEGCLDCLPDTLCAVCRACECAIMQDCTSPLHCRECPRS